MHEISTVVKQLRECASGPRGYGTVKCRSCIYYLTNGSTCIDSALMEAADIIEQLMKELSYTRTRSAYVGKHERRSAER